MNVTAVEAFIDISGTRRGRVCQRPDGKFQFVTEALTGEPEECLPYWRNEHPPSGIYERQVDAASALVATLQSAVRLGNIAATEFDLTVGPYPDLA